MTLGLLMEKINKNLGLDEKKVLLSTFLIGLFTHLPIMVRDIPNHDGLDNIFSYQNMVTSGRWFLSVACSITGFFTVPWLIGLLGLIILSFSALLLNRVLETKSLTAKVICGGLLVSFPALSSTFAYVYTLDGYMLGMLLAILSVYMVKTYKKGFILGGVALALSMGIYQSYLPFAIILSLYVVVTEMLKEEEEEKSKLRCVLEYLAMGVIGIAIYYILLEVLLFVQGKELDTYQGIDSLTAGNGLGIAGTLKQIYLDFFKFSIKGNVLINSIPAAVAFLILIALLIWVFISLIKEKKLLKKWLFYVIAVTVLIIIPIAFNAVMIISTGVNYHLLMRYQWVLCAVIPIALADKYLDNNISLWGILLAGVILTINYAVADNVGYTNLQRKYEKTYAYSLRLLDRIEQTEGYYPGIPVAIIGVVSDTQYPSTDITADVTWNMQGLSGDYLIYKPLNYQEFMQYYLGATLNFLPVEEVTAIYYSDEYTAMDSFPGADSTKVVNGILYVKTENKER